MADLVFKITIKPFFSKKELCGDICFLCDDQIFGVGYVLNYQMVEINHFGEHNEFICESCADCTSIEKL